VPAPFTLTELLSLQMSEDLFRVLEGTAFHDSIQSLLSKVRAALPAQTLALLDRLRTTFRVSAGPCKDYECFREIIEQVNQAVVNHRVVEMVYQPLARKEVTRRTVDPYGIRYADGTIYIVGMCHLRGELRIFVLDRIRELTLTDRAFAPPDDFDLDTYFRHSFKVMQEDLYTVTVRIAPEWAKWVGEKTWHQSQQSLKNPDASLDLTFRVAGLGEIQQWVMSMGPNARVLAPESLKVMVRDGLKQALAQYDEMPHGARRSKVGEPAPAYEKDDRPQLWRR
jgi:predicted DNA-binding transcriptional regulator YafY